MPTTVTVKGADELDRTLARAARDIEDLDDADRAAADLIARLARARAPKRSGRLAGSVQGSVEGGRATASSDLIYAPPIHWGWRARSIDPNRFLLEAAQESERQWLALYDGDIQKALDRVKGA